MLRLFLGRRKPVDWVEGEPVVSDRMEVKENGERTF